MKTFGNTYDIKCSVSFACKQTVQVTYVLIIPGMILVSRLIYTIYKVHLYGLSRVWRKEGSSYLEGHKIPIVENFLNGHLESFLMYIHNFEAI